MALGDDGELRCFFSVTGNDIGVKSGGGVAHEESTEWLFLVDFVGSFFENNTHASELGVADVRGVDHCFGIFEILLEQSAKECVGVVERVSIYVR